MTIVLGIPASILNSIEDRTLERSFRDALFPEMLFRDTARPELWEGNLGENATFTRMGLLAPATTPLNPGVDPTPASAGIEQWEVTGRKWGNTIDTHLPTSHVSIASQFLKNNKLLALNAAQTLNRLVRNAMYRAYCAGHTVNTVAGIAGDTTVRVAALNGFRRVLVNGRLQDVSAANPLAIAPGALAANTVVGTVPDVAADPDGPGQLLLGAALGGAGLPLRSAVLSSTRPTIIRSGGGTSVDALTSGDVLTMQDIIDAVARLRLMNVPAFGDGTYHVHLDSVSESQIFRDAAFQRLNTSLPDGIRYKDAAIKNLGGTIPFRNQECPRLDNAGATTATPTLSRYSRDIAAETVNNVGINVHRPIVCGEGCCVEKFFDESKFITEAGNIGLVGGFAVQQNNGLAIMVERIRHIIRAPVDRLFELVGSTWSFSGDFAIPSDFLSGDAAQYKRAVVIEHANA